MHLCNPKRPAGFVPFTRRVYHLLSLQKTDGRKGVWALLPAPLMLVVDDVVVVAVDNITSLQVVPDPCSQGSFRILT